MPQLDFFPYFYNVFYFLFFFIFFFFYFVKMILPQLLLIFKIRILIFSDIIYRIKKNKDYFLRKKKNLSKFIIKKYKKVILNYFIISNKFLKKLIKLNLNNQLDENLNLILILNSLIQK